MQYAIVEYQVLVILIQKVVKSLPGLLGLGLSTATDEKDSLQTGRKPAIYKSIQVKQRSLWINKEITMEPGVSLCISCIEMS